MEKLDGINDGDKKLGTSNLCSKTNIQYPRAGTKPGILVRRGTVYSKKNNIIIFLIPRIKNLKFDDVFVHQKIKKSLKFCRKF